MSLNDTVRRIQESIPGIRVLSAKHLKDPAGAAAYEKRHPKMGDERKRIRDEVFGGQKFRPGSVQAKRFEEERGYDGYDLVPKTDADGKTLVCRVCESKSGNFREVRWLDRDAEAVHANQSHGGRKDSVPVLNVTKKKPAPDEIPAYPLVYRKNSTARSNQRWNRQHKSMTLTHLGGMERSNENIGGIMGGHGAPEVVKAMQNAGVLQTRRDDQGNAVQTAVFSSRKDMEAKVKLFNRMQRDAEQRGFRGTRGGVKYIRHAGGTPD